jgi:hypothetical protein
MDDIDEFKKFEGKADSWNEKNKNTGFRVIKKLNYDFYKVMTVLAFVSYIAIIYLVYIGDLQFVKQNIYNDFNSTVINNNPINVTTENQYSHTIENYNNLTVNVNLDNSVCPLNLNVSCNCS